VLPGSTVEIGTAGSGQALAGSAFSMGVTSDVPYETAASGADFAGPGALAINVLRFKHHAVSEAWTPFDDQPVALDAVTPAGTTTHEYDLQLALPPGQRGGSYSTTLVLTCLPSA
jgi:hypothetical protein